MSSGRRCGRLRRSVEFSCRTLLRASEPNSATLATCHRPFGCSCWIITKRPHASGAHERREPRPCIDTPPSEPPLYLGGLFREERHAGLCFATQIATQLFGIGWQSKGSTQTEWFQVGNFTQHLPALTAFSISQAITLLLPALSAWIITTYDLPFRHSAFQIAAWLVLSEP
jgi:hypothetical protein